MAKRDNKTLYRELLINFINQEDPILEMLKRTANQMMQIEAEAKVGAQKGEHADHRNTNFSGVRVRRWDTRLGSIYLLIPKLRKGGFVPFFLTAKKRSELALLALIQEAFINGVSTRKMEKLAQSLGIENISHGQVSQICKELDEQVKSFQDRPLEEEYSVIWIDALYEKIRYDHTVISSALLVVYGVNSQGKREVLSIEPMIEESEATWRECFKNLKKRGLKKVALCVSDAHEGIQKAARKEWLGCAWQRCKVHFMRNILARVPHKLKQAFGAQLKQIWLEPDKASALKRAKMLMEEYADKLPEAIECLEAGLEDSLQYYSFPDFDKSKISSTNVLERLNREIRRRSRVVGVFPNKESYIRLITCYLMETTEDWETDQNYLGQEAIAKTWKTYELLLRKAA